MNPCKLELAIFVQAIFVLNCLSDVKCRNENICISTATKSDIYFTWLVILQTSNYDKLNVLQRKVIQVFDDNEL